MSIKLYYENVYMKSFDAKVISCTQKGKNFEVILDRTAFFPEGGGQPGDRGFIGSAKVIDTIEKESEIIHICTEAVFGDVYCALDWDFRFSNMQQHSGEHIFSGITHSLTGFDNVGFHMGEKEVTVDFNGSISHELLEEIEEKTNEVICENRKINIILPSADELKNYDYRSKKEIIGQVRLVEIEGADLCACCGTHVALTGEVGIVKVISSMNYKQGVRITLCIGKKALEDYRQKNNSVYVISASLKAKADEITDAVGNMKAKLNETRIALTETKRELLSLKAENTTEDFPVIFDSSGSADDARIAADMLANKMPVAFAFCGNDEEGYKYAIVSRNKDLRETAKSLNSALCGRGGGKPECVMGTVKTSKNEIEKYIHSLAR